MSYSGRVYIPGRQGLPVWGEGSAYYCLRVDSFLLLSRACRDNVVGMLPKQCFVLLLHRLQLGMHVGRHIQGLHKHVRNLLSMHGTLQAWRMTLCEAGAGLSPLDLVGVLHCCNAVCTPAEGAQVTRHINRQPKAERLVEALVLLVDEALALLQRLLRALEAGLVDAGAYERAACTQASSTYRIFMFWCAHTTCPVTESLLTQGTWCMQGKNTV